MIWHPFDTCIWWHSMCRTCKRFPTLVRHYPRVPYRQSYQITFVYFPIRTVKIMPSFCANVWQSEALLPNILLCPSLQLFFLKNGPTPASFLFIFVLFKHKFYRKNCRHQQDSNSDHRSWRRARWPLDHHHGPSYLKTRLQQMYLNRSNWIPSVYTDPVLCEVPKFVYSLLMFFSFFESTNFGDERRAGECFGW